MPFRSEAQRRAMFAAAEGRSTLGIPEEAAERFIEHSEHKMKRKKKGKRSPLAMAKAKMGGQMPSRPMPMRGGMMGGGM